MSTVNGTVTGVTLMSGNPSGATGTVSTTVYSRRSYLCSVDFGAYTGSGDTITVTGLNTAIAAATRNGKTLTLRSAVCVQPGVDTSGQAVYAAGSAVNALTIDNPTTTGDASGNLADAAGTELTSATASTGCGIIAVVDES